MPQPNPRGHWPLGKRRNASVRPPRGWPNLDAWLASVRAYIAANPSGRGRRGLHAILAERLGVHHSTLSAWLSGRTWPSQGRVDAIAAWMAEQGRKR